MIVSFKDKETEKVYQQLLSTKLPVDIQKTAQRKLVELNRAEKLSDITSLPGNHAEKLKGDLSGKWSIRINNQWRIIFVVNGDGDFEEVEIVDYH